MFNYLRDTLFSCFSQLSSFYERNSQIHPISSSFLPLTSFSIARILFVWFFRPFPHAAKARLSSRYFLFPHSSWLQRTAWEYMVFLLQGAWVVEITVTISYFWWLGPQFRSSPKGKKGNRRPLSALLLSLSSLGEDLSWRTKYHKLKTHCQRLYKWFCKLETFKVLQSSNLMWVT